LELVIHAEDNPLRYFFRVLTSNHGTDALIGE
jgi:hypothetical protein